MPTKNTLLLFALCTTTLTLLTASPVIATTADGLKQLSLSANIIPRKMNADVQHIVGADKLGKTAYLFNLKYRFNHHKKPLIPNFQTTHTFITLQAFQFLYLYDKANAPCFDGSTKGATQLQGFSASYGQRLSNHTKKYGSAGIGWSVGIGKGTTNWVECRHDPVKEDIIIPFGSTELFYTYNVTRLFYIEPTFTINLDAAGRGIITTPQIHIGMEF